MLIRDERPEDVDGIDAVHRAAFPTPLEAQLVRMLRESGNLRVSIVAEIDGAIAGHIAFSPVEVAGSCSGLGLGPVGVLPTRHKQGIGRALVKAGLTSCLSVDCGFVVVLGDPAYYAQFGFSPARMWKLRDEYGGGDAFQAIQIRPNTIPQEGGIVQYGQEFAIFAE